jgi:hypothetical protein
MTDFVGKTLAIDDSVIFIAPTYRMFVVGKIIKFTPKNVRVAFMNTWNFGKPGRRDEILQDAKQLIKIDGNELTTNLNIEEAKG